MQIETPKNEIIWLQIVKDGVVTHIITSTALRDIYYLYKVESGKPKKTRYKSDNPQELERKIK